MPGTGAFSDRPQHKLYLFDVDDTLGPPRRPVPTEMLEVLKAARKQAVIGFVGGSDFAKISEQLVPDGKGNVLDNFDYGFAENGLVAYKLGKPLGTNSFIKQVGEEPYKKLVNFILRYLSEIDIPIKRGTFVEFRNGMINVSPIGRNATVQERIDFQAYDKVHGVREAMVNVLREKFADYGLTFSIGGQISFDVFPNGWDKRYALRHVEDEHFDEIHFFGDKTYKGGNDHEIYADPRTIGHAVTGPADTLNQLKEIFSL
ncbi:eukaryotic phosphomannomutase [Dacryopinax primogenitus]|uniref:Phosphomannomutase n=1 Tax=Dacryopinax primogenitus (strain DJM 731) TaxID=1858805 RepID=M5G4J5_DACPD|nr:eukaryotic phosphomannomutase [Dacryopinax primogenitus]EJU03614.1 eukaryotic phosphomannomutase [Dacryopinax primogenitus]